MPKMTAAEEAALYNKAAWRLAMTADPKLRDPKKAIELGRKAVELAPDNPNYWHTLGTALYSSGNYPAAREALLKSIHFEQLAAKRSTLEGLIQTIKALPNADVSSVRKEFDASLGLGKSSPSELAQHYSLLAMTLWKLDDKDAARKALSLIVDPSSSFTTSGPETRRLIAEARKLVTAEVESPKADDAPASKP